MSEWNHYQVLLSRQDKNLLRSCLKWIRRIEERQSDLPKSFMDGCDPKPLRKRLEKAIEEI
jgi:hypothetical protein